MRARARARARWRAPEVLLGDQEYSYAIDSWSLGLVLAEVGGELFHKQNMGTQTATQIGQLMAYMWRLGTPSATSLTSLPLWWAQMPSFRGQHWQKGFRDLFGGPGVDFVERLLEWCPEKRLPIGASCRHAFLNPARFELGGQIRGFESAAGTWKGQRHDWNILCGNVGADVLRWLRSDDALDPSAEAFVTYVHT